MLLTAGTKLGTYEIVAPLGTGGMGRGLQSPRHPPRPHRRYQDPSGASLGEPGAEGALRARGEGGLEPQPSSHLHTLRRRSSRRHRLPGDGVPRGRVPCRALGAWSFVDQRSSSLRHRDRRCTRLRAPPGSRAPGLETRKHHAHLAGRQAGRFRAGNPPSPRRERTNRRCSRSNGL